MVKITLIARLSAKYCAILKGTSMNYLTLCNLGAIQFGTIHAFKADTDVQTSAHLLFDRHLNDRTFFKALFPEPKEDS